MTTFEVTRKSSGEELIVKPWGLRELRRFIEDIVEEYDLDAEGLRPSALIYESYEGTVFTNRRNVVILRVT